MFAQQRLEIFLLYVTAKYKYYLLYSYIGYNSLTSYPQLIYPLRPLNCRYSDSADLTKYRKELELKAVKSKHVVHGHCWSVSMKQNMHCTLVKLHRHTYFYTHPIAYEFLVYVFYWKIVSIERNCPMRKNKQFIQVTDAEVCIQKIWTAAQVGQINIFFHYIIHCATSALDLRRSNHSAIDLIHSWLDLIHNWLELIQNIGLSLKSSARVCKKNLVNPVSCGRS